MGFCIGFNGIIFKFDLNEVIVKTPLEKILIETDCPYLTPNPMTGRNEPIYVKYVAEKIAKIKNIGYEEIINTTTKRANNHILYLMRDKKIIKPRICQILLTGLTTVKRSIMMLFQIHLPMKLIMIIAIKKATMVEIISR